MPDNQPSNSLSRVAPKVRLFAIAAAVAAAGALASLLLDPMGSNAAQDKGPVVSTTSTGLGRILVNSSGDTLYVFSKDKNDKSACAGSARGSGRRCSRPASHGRWLVSGRHCSGRRSAPTGGCR
jgi:hypothetical protein